MFKVTAKKYTAQLKRETIQLAKEVGPGEAARRLGIPAGTVSCWGCKDRKAREKGSEWPLMPSPKEEVDEVVLPSKVNARDKASSKPRKVAKIYSPSQRGEALELVDQIGISAAGRRLGIGRSSLYEWQRKVRLAAQGKGDSPTSGPAPEDIEARRDAEILAMWREHPGLGPSQIRNQLRRRGVKVSTNTVRHVMEDAGYRPPKVRRREHSGRYEAVRPNHLWHLDFVQRWIGRASTFTLIFIDDYSRFVRKGGYASYDRRRVRFFSSTRG